MRKMAATALAGLLAMQGTGALAAGCATATDISALKTAALQQELMVAAFSCHAVDQYNRFVLAHRPELMTADAQLKAYFVHVRGGEAGYHTYKTELANASSLRSLHDGDSFCADADDEFDMASDATLSAAVDAIHWRAASYPACAPGVTELAATTPAPRPAPETRSSRDNGERRATTMSDGPSLPAPHRRIEADSL